MLLEEVEVVEGVDMEFMIVGRKTGREEKEMLALKNMRDVR